MKHIISILVVLVIGLGSVALVHNVPRETVGGSEARAPRFTVASTTAITVGNTSVRLLGSSTPTARLGALIQPINCTVTASGVIFLRADRDIAAVANQGFAAYASSTLALEDYPGIAVPQGSVQAITSAGTCTVLVTEWRSQY